MPPFLFVCDLFRIVQMGVNDIHRTAIIEPGAQIGEGCRIGPYCHIGPDVRLARNNVLHGYVVITGHTVVGDDNEIYPFASLGTPAEDLKFQEQWVSGVRIGNGNILREYVTINASARDGGLTTIGSHCFLLSYSHVAHDCVLGDNVTLSCDAKIAGHVQIGDQAIVSAKTGVVQFVRIGRFAFVGGLNKVAKDILPFCIADGYPAGMRGINKVGLERNGFTTEQLRSIREAYRTMMRSGLPLDQACSRLNERFARSPEVQEMVAFARASKIGLARPRARGSSDEP